MMYNTDRADVAQSVEQLIRNLEYEHIKTGNKESRLTRHFFCLIGSIYLAYFFARESRSLL